MCPATDRSDADRAVPPSPAGAVPVPAGRRPWWRRPWVLPLAVVALGFLAYVVPPYLTFDPDRARIPNLRRDVAVHYPLLAVHIYFGTIAFLTLVPQLWPWLRGAHPAVHRWTGRCHVFLGALPTGVLALAIMPFSAGPFGNAVAAILWLGTTVRGYQMARRGRYVEHRRWMVYSAALTLQIVWGRVLLNIAPHVPGFDASSFPLLLETATWIGFVINLLAAHWWLEHTADRAEAIVAGRDARAQPGVPNPRATSPAQKS